MELYRHSFAAMACTAEVQLYAADPDQARRALATVQQEVERIEAKYSRYREDSVLGAINRGAGGVPVAVDAETAALLDYADACWRQSGGLFDITSGVLRRVWNFRQGLIPGTDALVSVLARIGWDRVRRAGGTIALPAGMEIDLGGIGKEYAADRAAAAAAAQGIDHGLVNLGGDIRVIGPHPGGRPWTIGITHPRDPAHTIAHLSLHEGALATSGDYQRFFLQDGKRYCHILDPHTGWPVDGPQSVSVIAPLCTVAGSCATIAMLNAGGAADYLRAQGLPYLLVDRDAAVSGTVMA